MIDATQIEAQQSEDKELVLAFQRGQEEAYEAIHERHQARVHGVCRKMLIDKHDAQEASQETFLRVYQALGRFNGRYQLGAWITRIATNVCLDQLRAKGRGPKDIAPLELVDGYLHDPNPSGDPETVTIRNAESRRVRRVLRGLPPMHRAAIVLRDFEGLSYQEIAVAMQITEPQVKALLHRARQGFKRDWLSSVASIFIPMRWVQKMRGFETPSLEQVAQTGASSTPMVTSCTTMLHQCGQVLADKIVPVATALAVGVTGGVAISNTGSSHEPAAKVQAAPSDMVKDGLEAKLRAKEIRGPAVKREKRAPAAGPEAEEPVAQPTPVSEPSTSPPPEEPQPEPTEGPAQEEPNDGGQASPPPPPFLPALGFSHGAIRQSSVIDHELSAICGDAPDVDQVLTAMFSDGENSYPAELELDADLADTEFSLRLFPDGEDGMDVEYEGAGALKTQSRNGATADLTYSGTYANIDAPDAKRRGMPEGGEFDLSMRIDCDSQTLTSEALTLHG